MVDLSKIYLFRLTHIDNIPHILQHGITHRNSPNKNPNFVPIGDESLIRSREKFFLINGISLGAYIPFYFCIRSPMLYVIQKGFNMVKPTPPEEIVYCITSINSILAQKLQYIFTDGHAVDSYSSQYSNSDIEELDKIIDWAAVKDKYWKEENDLDKKRRKEAEFLILGDIPSSCILGFAVYNENAKSKLINSGATDSKVLIKSDYYF